MRQKLLYYFVPFRAIINSELIKKLPFELATNYLVKIIFFFFSRRGLFNGGGGGGGGNATVGNSAALKNIKNV